MTIQYFPMVMCCDVLCCVVMCESNVGDTEDGAECNFLSLSTQTEVP